MPNCYQKHRKCHGTHQIASKIESKIGSDSNVFTLSSIFVSPPKYRINHKSDYIPHIYSSIGRCQGNTQSSLIPSQRLATSLYYTVNLKYIEVSLSNQVLFHSPFILFHISQFVNLDLFQPKYKFPFGTKSPQACITSDLISYILGSHNIGVKTFLNLFKIMIDQQLTQSIFTLQ